MTIAVLGAGMVGRAIALDISKNHRVTSFDIDRRNLEELHRKNDFIETTIVDLSDYNSYDKWLKSFDLIVTAVPGFMGYKTLETVINCGKDVVDISFFPENVLQLDVLAKEKNVTAITDCGVAPGMSNLILGRYNEEMKIDSFECYVGGLPVHPRPPFYYKAPFSPVDVIQEYIRPSRLVENGEIVIKPALSDRELIMFDEIGKLEAFNTDGLRSLVYTMKHIPHMKEKTLRYPGHIDLIISLKQAGFFNTIPLDFDGTKKTALDFTSRLLIDEWKLEPEDGEFTIMKVIIKEKKKTIEYNLLDKYDTETKTSSMARTTGYTCTAAVNLIVRKLFNQKGVFPPELIGREKSCFDFVINYLRERNVIWKKKEQ